MKKIILLILFTWIGITTFGQVIKYRTQSVATSEINQSTGKQSEFSPFADLNVLITVDLDNLRIKIYLDEIQTYDIVKFEGETTNPNGDITTNLACIDNQGNRARLRHRKSSTTEYVDQLYVDGNGGTVVFNMNKLD